ncbi:uncharacterized protein [Parasteatoda tepidariorum]|uniref:uncharacterized protein n=1 Tax=Parasteatoda tepidariorum TaxID=114398 RepID=UPI001C724515|nr:uncharacterized protein LOC122269147 [Parasteatoda tepidariorum]XP_042896881.1 uncharacterized protein LOC122269147 [Parasteatoda tepidariorum]
MSLYRTCIWKIATLIKKGYWSISSGSQDDNPFSFLPPEIINEITSTVIQISTPNGVKVTDLYCLLTSGRLERLVLDDILLSTEELISILMSLSVACQNLKTLTFRNVNCTDPYSANAKVFKPGNALECLLGISPQIESLESCIRFNVEVINRCDKLKFLNLNFVSEKPVCRFILNCGYYEPNHSLKSLSVFEDYRNPVPFCDLVPVLKYCKELVYIKADISRPLEFLHIEELYDGSLTTQYKLQRCYLGNPYFDNGAVSSVAMHIATLTCPEMKEIDVLANDNEAIFALSDFKNLNSLLVQWEEPNGGNFQLGVQLLLEKIGVNLKKLHVINFYYVDWAVIAKYCTQLEILKVEFFNEIQSYERPTVCLQYLTSLYIELLDPDFYCHKETLIMLLSSCTELKHLRIDGARNLCDHTLNKILAKNNLSKLVEALLFECSLTENGIRNLISSLSSLEFFQFSSTLIDFEDAANIVHEINPHILLMSEE